MKKFYAQHIVMPKVHIANTNLPIHLEEMLKLLIEEDSRLQEAMLTHAKNESDSNSKSDNLSCASPRECFDFVLTNRPFDLLTDICLTDSPVGATVCVLNWMRRFLTCLQHPRLDHKSILQPTQASEQRRLAVIFGCDFLKSSQLCDCCCFWFIEISGLL